MAEPSQTKEGLKSQLKKPKGSDPITLDLETDSFSSVEDEIDRVLKQMTKITEAIATEIGKNNMPVDVKKESLEQFLEAAKELKAIVTGEREAVDLHIFDDTPPTAGPKLPTVQEIEETIGNLTPTPKNQGTTPTPKNQGTTPTPKTNER